MKATTNYDVERYRNPIRGWWVSLLLGIILFVIGVIVFIHPVQSFLFFAYLFGVTMIVSGVIELYGGIITSAQRGKGWLIAAGAIEILLGITLLLLPNVLLTLLPYILAFWLMFRGFLSIGIASDMMAYGIRGGGWTIFFAILLIVLSFIILINPIIGAGVIVIWMGLSLLAAGISLIAFSIYLLGLKKHLKK